MKLITRKSGIRMLALAALLPIASFAQDITGTWQGALQIPQAGRELRTVIKITKGDDGGLKSTFYSIDQGGQGLPVATTTLQGSTLKLSLPAIGGSYEGKVSADGNTITGSWTQGQPLALNLTRATKATEWTIPEPPPPPKLMAADATPSFEVSTVKPSKPDARFSILVNRSGMLNTTDTSLADLIKFAYDLHPHQITGGPSWLDSDKFDVMGKPDTPGIPSGKQLKLMMQKMLKERFGLTYHQEKKELSVYAITVAKGGAKIAKDENNPNGLPGFGGGPQGLNVRNATIAEFASMLQARILDKPVVDQTGFGATRYDFVLKFTPDAAQAQGLGGPPPASDPDAPPDIFTAFQQQLGLKLESVKAPTDVIVIDKAEKPSAN